MLLNFNTLNTLPSSYFPARSKSAMVGWLFYIVSLFALPYQPPKSNMTKFVTKTWSKPDQNFSLNPTKIIYFGEDNRPFLKLDKIVLHCLTLCPSQPTTSIRQFNATIIMCFMLQEVSRYWAMLCSLSSQIKYCHTSILIEKHRLTSNFWKDEVKKNI